MAVLDVATHAIVTVAPGDSLKRAMSLMTNHRVRHLPVIANGDLVGIVSIGDVVKLRLEDLETESNVLRDAYVAGRVRGRSGDDRALVRSFFKAPDVAYIADG
jgi:CBS domain-containing protein